MSSTAESPSLSRPSYPRIAHVIGDLNLFGGTEATLLRYLNGSCIPKPNHRVFALKTAGTGKMLGAQMIAAGFTVVELHQRTIAATLFGAQRLYRELRAYNPDVISGWLYLPSLLATALASWLPNEPSVVWHIRSLPFASPLRKPGRFVLQRVLAAVSRMSDAFLASNSVASMRAHVGIGFDGNQERWTIIPNGIDTQQYYPDEDGRRLARADLELPHDALVVGFVGRFVAEKGYPVLFEALHRATQELDESTTKRLYVVGVGNGVTVDNPVIERLLAEWQLPRSRTRLLGKRADVPSILRAFDVYVLPSISESFPNALVEAMATGLFCLSSDVGECRTLLPPAYLVPPGNAVALGKALSQALRFDARTRSRIGLENRRRVVQQIPLNRMIENLDKLFFKAARYRGPGKALTTT